MSGYEVTAHSAARASVIFALLADCTTWPKWSVIDAGEIVDGEGPEGVGTTRSFRVGRNFSRERIVELTPDKHFGYVMDAGILPDYRGDVFLTPLADGGTKIRWRGTFRPRPPGTGWLWRLYMTYFMGRFARGLAAYAETLERAT